MQSSGGDFWEWSFGGFAASLPAYRSTYARLIANKRFRRYLTAFSEPRVLRHEVGQKDFLIKCYEIGV